MYRDSYDFYHIRFARKQVILGLGLRLKVLVANDL